MNVLNKKDYKSRVSQKFYYLACLSLANYIPASTVTIIGPNGDEIEFTVDERDRVFNLLEWYALEKDVDLTEVELSLTKDEKVLNFDEKLIDHLPGYFTLIKYKKELIDSECKLSPCLLNCPKNRVIKVREEYYPLLKAPLPLSERINFLDLPYGLRLFLSSFFAHFNELYYCDSPGCRAPIAYFKDVHLDGNRLTAIEMDTGKQINLDCTHEFILVVPVDDGSVLISLGISEMGLSLVGSRVYLDLITQGLHASHTWLLTTAPESPRGVFRLRETDALYVPVRLPSNFTEETLSVEQLDM